MKGKQTLRNIAKHGRYLPIHLLHCTTFPCRHNHTSRYISSTPVLHIASPQCRMDLTIHTNHFARPILYPHWGFYSAWVFCCCSNCQSDTKTSEVSVHPLQTLKADDMLPLKRPLFVYTSFLCRPGDDITEAHQIRLQYYLLWPKKIALVYVLRSEPDFSGQGREPREAQRDGETMELIVQILD